jgi:hypothetical protein
MRTTAAKFVSAIFATVIASSTLTAAPEVENAEKEKPADTCLLGPSASTPPGGHWYYRADRANNRNCWYLGEAKDKRARKTVAEEDSVAAEKPAAPAPKKPVAQRSITDARAELPPQSSAEPETKTVATQRITAAPADAQRAVATRWPEPAAVSPPAPSPAPVTKTPEAPPQNQAQAQAPAQQATPAAPPPRPFAPQPLPAKANAADKPLSLPMLLTVLVGGLSVIGVMASVLFARGKSQQGKPRPKRRLSRSAPMPPVQTAEKPLLQTAEKPLPEEPLPEKPLPEDSRAPDDPTRRLQQMLADIQKRAAA